MARRPAPAPDLAALNAGYFGDAYYSLYHNGLLPAQQTADEVAFLLRTLKPRPGARWLDAPCGHGRHLLALAGQRHDLQRFGIDRNAAFLQEPGLHRAAAVARADLRALPWCTGTFDAALVLLNSFGYFEEDDDARMLFELRRVLKPGGRLVLDLANRRALLDIVRRQPAIRYCVGEREAEEYFAWDADRQRLRNLTRWSWPGGAHDASYDVRLYTPAQAARLLERCGFMLRKVYGDFCGEPFNPYQSERMLIVAGRAR